MSGDATVGSTLSVDVGAWSPTPAGVQVRRLADGQPIPGTDGATHVVLGAAQVGRQVVAR